MQSGFRAICVGRCLHVCFSGFSQDLRLKVWQIQSTLFICIYQGCQGWVLNKHSFHMKKPFLFSIRPCLYILLLLLGIAIPQKAAAYTVDGVVYTLYSHGSGDDCVADSAKITGCESTYAGGGIRTSITREYTYSKFIGYDTNNKPIYQTVTRYLTYPVTTMTSGAFAGSNITSFNLPGSIKIESSYLNLSNCKKLTNADIPSTAHYFLTSSLFSAIK